MESDKYDGHFANYLSHHSPKSFVQVITGPNSGGSPINHPNRQFIEDSDQLQVELHQQVTIGTLPDDVLLKIFKAFVNETYIYLPISEEWRMLAHVCRRWRDLAFTSPRHLNLQLFFRAPERSVKRMLDIWPELPISISAFNYSTKDDIDNIASALRLNHRVSSIHLDYTSDSAWETFGPLMHHPFPALTSLLVQRSYRLTQNTISHSFLGGSAPSLLYLKLEFVPFPALPNLLSSATNLVSLLYDNIPRYGYISPQAMVTGLSALTRLETLSLTFLSSEYLPDRETRIPAPHVRNLLPALTGLRFRGVSEYMEYLVAQIHGPLLESMVITFFHREVLEVSELSKFIRRADKLRLVDRGEVTFKFECVSIKLSPHLCDIDPKTLMLRSARVESDFRLSYFAHFCASCLPTPSPFECLYIRDPLEYTWERVTADPNARWLEVLRPFNAVKHLRLSQIVALRVAQALRMLTLEQVMEVLPALESVFISGLEPFGPVKEAMTEFAYARQLSGHPVSIHDWREV